jgi:amino acid adenylation domain-containing protein/thioester reductase-like protein
MMDIKNLSLDQKRALLAELLQKKASESKSEYPLSYGQEALWFVQQLAPENAAYNVNFAGYISTDLDIPALRRSFQKLVNRHAALRTFFPVCDGKPVQRVQKNLEVHLLEIEASPWSQDKLYKRLVQEAHRPFDLKKGPILRVKLFMRPALHVLLVSVHHIVYDAISLVIILDELRTLYYAEKSGRKLSLPSLRVQYTDYVCWQNEMLKGKEGERLRAYWQKQLAGELLILKLPTDRPRPPFQTFHGATHPFRINKELSQRLKVLARREGVTPYQNLLAAFQVLLYRYSGQEDILVGSPMAGRTKAEFESLVGYFMNPVVLRADLSGDPTFKEFLDHVHRTVLEAFENQDYPFLLLVEDLQPIRDPSRSPIFQFMFNMPKAHRLEEQGVAQFVLGDSGARIDLGGIDLEIFAVEQHTAMFDLLLTMVEAEGIFSASLQYNTDIFNADTIARMVAHFQTILTSIVANPTQKVSELPILTDAERHQLLAEWNNTRIDYPLSSCFQELFEYQVERTSDTVAVMFEDKQLSYQQLNQRINCLAHLLIQQGVGTEVIVALLTERGIDLLTAIIAIFKTGGTYLPLDPRHPPQRMFQMLEQSDVFLVLTTKAFMPVFSQVLAQSLSAKLPRIMQMEELSQQESPKKNLPLRCTPNNLAYVIYTSGSTGVPKGVMIEHRGMLNHLFGKNLDLQLTDADLVAQTASQCFDISLWQFLAILLVGGRVCIFSDETAYDPRRLLRKAERESISIIETVPSLLRAMLEWVVRRRNAPPDLSALRWMITTGETLAPELCRKWHSYYPNIPLLNAYGPTECSDDVTHYVVYQPPAADVINISIGRPIANIRLYVVDRHMQPVPINVSGELCSGGVGVGRGYLNDVERTAEVFIPDPFIKKPGALLFKTGDCVRYLSDGNIEFLGRIDNQVKIRGYRIELEEIEAALNQHPEVRGAVVLVREDEPGDKRLVAYVVADKEQAFTVSRLRSFTLEKLPNYMVPSAFVILKEFPLTSNGKVDHQALPVPAIVRSEMDEAYESPRAPVDEILAGIWAKVLGLDQVGIHDDFFALGGHSLQAVQIVSEIQEVFQVELPLHSFFTALTVAELAKTIELVRQSGSVAIAMNAAVELNAEAILDLTICCETVPVERVTSPAYVFLTGTTGFLGAFLLPELLEGTQADIYCLVRAADIEEGKKRILANLETYSLLNKEQISRIIPVVGDLSQSLLGISTQQFHLLAGKLDVIYHNGAWVNYILPYSTLKATNVLGTHEVLRLAFQNKLKPVHYVSSLGVFGLVEDSWDQAIREDDTLEHGRTLYDGYAQSKWVAEKLVTIARSKGLPVCIYRPGMITGDHQNGICNTNDFMWRLIKGCIQLGNIPEVDAIVDMTPVDYVSKAIFHLSRQEESPGKVFHLMNPHPIHWNELVNWVCSFGYSLRKFPYEQWLTRAINHIRIYSDNALYPFMSFFSEKISEEQGSFRHKLTSLELPQYDCRNTIEGLKDTAIVCSPMDDRLFGIYFTYLTQSGFLTAPKQSNRQGGLIPERSE